MNERAPFTGRAGEISLLNKKFEEAVNSKGSTIIISGEPGIGKSRLVEEFLKNIGKNSAEILRSEAIPSTVSPFIMFSKALEPYIEEPLFREQEYISFNQIFAIDRTGVLVAKSTPKDEEIDPDIFAGMFSAVQDFIRDSFSNSKAKGLGRLDYGDMKILIEHGEHLFLTAIFKGKEHPEMKKELRRTMERIEVKYGNVLERWGGKMEEVRPIQNEIRFLADRRFLVRRELEGVKLENERIKIADQILEILKSISEKNTIVLLLEDVHWADESSLFVMQYLARNILDERILIIGTLRVQEGETGQEYMEKMREEGTISDMKLEEIGKESMQKIIDELYPENSFPEDFMARIIDKSEGNPLFMIEFMRNMEEDGDIEKRDGGYVLTSEVYSIPDTLEEIVEKRLENLDMGSMMLAEYASCIGREFDKNIMVSAIESESVMRRLSSSGIVVFNDGKGEFIHGIFQEVIYNGIKPRWKQIYHRSIGRYYESEYMGREDEVIYDLARHFSYTNEYEKAFDYSLKAGEKAESTYAAEQAIGFYEQALNLLENIRDGERIKMRGEILERVGDIRMLIGDYNSAIEEYRNALDMERSPERKAVLYGRKANALEKKGDFESAMENCRTGLEILGKKTSPEKAALLIKIAWIDYRNGRYDEALRIVGDALGIAEDLDYRELIALASHTQGSIFLNRGRYDDSLKSFHRALEIREKLDDEWGMALTLNNIGNVFRTLGWMDEALRTYSRSLALMEKVGSIYGQAALHNNLGLIFHFKGDLENAVAEYEKILGITRSIGDSYGMALSLSNMGNAMEDRGELEKALEIFEEGMAIQKEIGDREGEATSLSNIGNVMHEMKRYEESIAYNSRSVEMMRGMGDPRGISQSLKNLAVSYLGAGMYAEGMKSVDEALKLSSEIGAKSIEGAACWVKAAIYRRTKEWVGSEEWFERSMEILDTDEGVDRTALAKGLYEYALLFDDVGRKDDAKKSLERSLSMFESMGMTLWADRCRKAMEELR